MPRMVDAAIRASLHEFLGVIENLTDGHKNIYLSLIASAISVVMFVSNLAKIQIRTPLRMLIIRQVITFEP